MILNTRNKFLVFSFSVCKHFVLFVESFFVHRLLFEFV